MNLAFCGLGTMGGPMAANLLKAGHTVVVHNRTRSKEEPLAVLGAKRAATPREAAKGAEILFVCVSDTPDVAATLFDPGTGAAAGLSRGALVVDCSTISPAESRRFAARLAEAGVGFVDAPVSGGSEGAQKATLAIMCGGSPEDFGRAQPILAHLGKSITHVGPVGAGQIAKAVNQVVIAGTYQAVAEGLALAAKSGVDPRRVIEAIRGGAAASWIMDNRSGNMVEDRYPLGFRMKLHRKDLAIALAEARESGLAMPLAAMVAAFEDGLIGAGFGDEDVSALARAVRRAGSIEPGPLPKS